MISISPAPSTTASAAVAAPAVRYKGSDLASLADDAQIATWTDSSGNGRDATQATAGKRPLKKTVSGHAVARFDGTDDLLSTAAFALGTEGLSVIAVVSRPNWATNAYRALFGHGYAQLSGRGMLLSSSDAGNGGWAIGDFTLLTNGWSTGRNPRVAAAHGLTGSAFHVVCAQAGPTSTTISVDGSRKGINNSGMAASPAGTNALVLGSTATLDIFDGDIAEFLLFDTELGTTERNDWITTLKTAYAIA